MTNTMKQRLIGGLVILIIIAAVVPLIAKKLQRPEQKAAATSMNMPANAKLAPIPNKPTTAPKADIKVTKVDSKPGQQVGPKAPAANSAPLSIAPAQVAGPSKAEQAAYQERLKQREQTKRRLQALRERLAQRQQTSGAQPAAPAMPVAAKPKPQAQMPKPATQTVFVGPAKAPAVKTKPQPQQMRVAIAPPAPRAKPTAVKTLVPAKQVKVNRPVIKAKPTAPVQPAPRKVMAAKPAPKKPVKQVSRNPLPAMGPGPVLIEPHHTQPAHKVHSKAAHTLAHAGQRGWAVQLGSFANQKNAKRLVASLQDKGFAAFIKKSGHKRPLYRVLVGPVPKKADANDHVAILAKQVRLQGVVVFVK